MPLVLVCRTLDKEKVLEEGLSKSLIRFVVVHEERAAQQHAEPLAQILQIVGSRPERRELCAIPDGNLHAVAHKRV